MHLLLYRLPRNSLCIEKSHKTEKSEAVPRHW